MDANQQFLVQVWHLCKRPRLYTLAGGREELIAFVHGLEIGIFGDRSPLRQFNQWLAKVCAVPEEGMWPQTIHRCMGDADSAPQRLMELLERFFLEVHQVRLKIPVIPPGFSCSYVEGAHEKDQKHSGN